MTEDWPKITRSCCPAFETNTTMHVRGSKSSESLLCAHSLGRSLKSASTLIASTLTARRDLVRSARRLRESKGLLENPSPRRNRPLKASVKTSITNFYQDDRISYCLPGKKDVVRGNQKRLLLLNLKEAFVQWKQENPILQASFSTFASLRPPWCVLAGSAGTRSVCVCEYHQNVKLMLHALSIQETASALMAMTVCSLENQDCMLNACSQCPGLAPLKNFLRNHTPECDEIRYKQWVRADKCLLMTVVSIPSELLDELVERLEKLKRHHYVSKLQSNYLRSLKATLAPTEAIVLMDFAENYNFIVQDASQSYHWNASQATIHPIVVYFRSDDHEPGSNSCSCVSYIVVTDALKHDNAAVHAFQRHFLHEIRLKKENLIRIHYFTDGVASQYKNRKNFVNLAFHKQDFGLEATWNFFATSHGKSPCDGLGGTLKRLASKASLQRPLDNQILTPKDLYDWASQSMKTVNVLWVPDSAVTAERQSLSSCYETARSIPKTRQYHHLAPKGQGCVSAKITSSCTAEQVYSVQQ